MRARVNPFEADADFGIAIDKLIQYGRPKAAIICFDRTHKDKKPLDKSRCVKALLAAVSSSESLDTLHSYHLVETIKALQDDPDTNPADLVKVEWSYLPLLGSDDNASPKTLEHKLASDASFFCEVIRLLYRSKNTDESVKEPSEQDKSIATNVWRLLHEWRTPPGTQLDGTFSHKDFRMWLGCVKQECAESGHLDIALQQVGQVLLYCQSDPDGLWIDKTVAEALNGKDAEHIRRGFNTRVYNSRGLCWVDPTGKPERELAEQYREKANAAEDAGYQRFAATLRVLADSYDSQADQIVAESDAERKELL